MFFWLSIVISLLTGLYGLYTNQLAIFFPYTFLNPAILILTSQSAHLKTIKNFISRSWQPHIETIGALLVLFNIPGSIFLHKAGIQYDMALHAIGYWLLYIALVVLYPTAYYAVTQKQLSLKHVHIASFLIAAATGFIHEGVQKLSDVIFGTNLFFDVKQSIKADFWTDIIMDVIGVLLGMLYVYKFMNLSKYFTKQMIKPASSPPAPASLDRA